MAVEKPHIRLYRIGSSYVSIECRGNGVSGWAHMSRWDVQYRQFGVRARLAHDRWMKNLRAVRRLRPAELQSKEEKE